MLQVEEILSDSHYNCSKNHHENISNGFSNRNRSSLKQQQQHQKVSEDKERLAFLELMSLSTVPMAIKAITLLDVPQIIANAGDGAMLSAKQIAERILNTNNNVNVLHLDRILRFLASCDVFTESLSKKQDDEGEVIVRYYGLTPVCKYLLREGASSSLSPLLLVRHDKQLFQSLHHLHEAVVSEEVPFVKAHGQNLFEFLENNPQQSNLFNTAMSNLSENYMGAILHSYHGFRDVKTLVDVGGGTGSSLAMIISKHQHIHGINFDLPRVVSAAPNYLRMEHIGGNLFEHIPHGDGMFIKHIMHNWGDEQCLKMLRNCYDSLREGGKMIMVEFLAPGDGDHSQRARVALSYDLVMMAHFLGKERSEREFRKLLTLAGFTGIRIALRIDCIAVIEAHKAYKQSH